ncbi:nitroreductase family protein [Paludisphaera rhizosphaerae]|uniref:nitroreductase family protein n=1 Tax=Paludisphaera rhizosphaerae TaxID=2711216 RepID=UPI0013EC8A79|nr:nitroreductase family protein [Paludisphaera rhizosphaerae]
MPEVLGPTPPRPLTVEEAATRRRATPTFDSSRGLDSDLLEKILRLATLAPSSTNLQPWRFLVVRDPANRRRLQSCARNQPKVGQASVVVIVLGYHHPDRTHLEPMLALQVESGACTPERAAEIRGRAASGFRDLTDRALWATRSTMLAAATMMLAAESLGVASAPMEGFDEEAVKREFGVPEDHSVCCLVALGYAAVEKPFPGRFDLDEVCYAEHFGRPWTG